MHLYLSCIVSIDVESVSGSVSGSVGQSVGQSVSQWVCFGMCFQKHQCSHCIVVTHSKAYSLSMLRIERPLSRTSPIVFRRYIFIRLSPLKDRSAEQDVAGMNASNFATFANTCNTSSLVALMTSETYFISEWLQ